MAVLTALSGMHPGGLHAAALLLDSLPPVVAAALVMDAPLDARPTLLPLSLRTALLQLMQPAVRDNLRAAAAAVASAAAKRNAANLAALRSFACGRCVSCSQVVLVLRVLGPGVPEDRCEAVATLWSKVVDRSNMVEVSLPAAGLGNGQSIACLGGIPHVVLDSLEFCTTFGSRWQVPRRQGLAGEQPWNQPTQFKVFESLTSDEQLRLMGRLGHYLVWATLARPEGLHFRWGPPSRLLQDAGIHPESSSHLPTSSPSHPTHPPTHPPTRPTHREGST